MTATPQANPTSQSLTLEAPTEMDVATAWAHLGHGDSWRLVRLGAHNRLYSQTSGYIQFDVRTGERRTTRVIVKLSADDTYAVELGHVACALGEALEYQGIEQARGLYADQLGQAVEAMLLECVGSEVR